MFHLIVGELEWSFDVINSHSPFLQHGLLEFLLVLRPAGYDWKLDVHQSYHPEKRLHSYLTEYCY